jgi:hypothetical protein
MMQPWIGERMTQEHRRDLATPIRADNRSSRGAGDDLAPTAAKRQALSRSTVGHRVTHRPIGRHIGGLLIRAGTRLGGASISPS